MHLQVLRELTGVIVKPLSIISERSWRMGEVPKDWSKANITLVFKRDKEEPGSFWLVSLTLIPGNVVKILIFIESQNGLG